MNSDLIKLAQRADLISNLLVRNLKLPESETALARIKDLKETLITIEGQMDELTS